MRLFFAIGYACGTTDVGRILRTFKIKKNVEVTDNGKIII
ncbi:helicase [Blautia sp. An249]|nr:helicase [Blautia sp. An249]